MARRRHGIRYWLVVLGAVLVTLGVIASVFWGDDIIKALLDPKVPFGKDNPPPAPNYALRSSWAVLPAPGATPASVDIFFIHPTSYPASFTSYNGGRHWNAPVNDHAAMVALSEVMLPNYAAPFDAVGDVYAPRYRQATLYARSTLWDDAIEARQFAYGDVKTAFEDYLARFNHGRPFILAGVEQGGDLGARLLHEAIAPDPALRRRLVGAYLIDTVVPADEYGPGALVPPCEAGAGRLPGRLGGGAAGRFHRRTAVARPSDGLGSAGPAAVARPAPSAMRQPAAGRGDAGGCAGAAQPRGGGGDGA